MRFTFALAALTAAALHATPAQAAPAWITIGDKAFALLMEQAPQSRVLSSRRIAVDLPEVRGGQTVVRGVEVVSAVEVDDSVLDGLVTAVHDKLNRCGGFAQHRSEAEALAVLHRLEASNAAGGISPSAPSYAIDSQAQVNPLLPQLQASNLLDTIGSLAAFQNRRYNSSHGTLASTWLFNRWSQLNPGNRRDVKVSQITHAGWTQKSVQFEIIGSGNGGETIVMGAHLDSINGGSSTSETQRAPGADDDASGVAALTEIIRVLMASGYQPKRNIRFIAYAAEEVGLRGSQDIVAGQAARRDRVVGVLQLDMVAFRGDPTDLWIYTDYTNAAQNQFLAALAAAYLPTLTVGYDACGYGCSDHASWFNAGFAASLPFEASDAHYNFALHTVNDTIATFGNQADHALKFTKLGLAYLVELASDLTPARPAAAVAAAAAAERR
jgi:leucyl aminopeptidase